MEELKSILPILSFFFIILGFVINWQWQIYQKKKDAQTEVTNRQQELESAKQEFRDYADSHHERALQKLDKMAESIGGVIIRLSKIEIKTDLWWSCIEKNITTLIKSMPTHPDKDILLTHTAEGILTLQEAELLKEILVSEKDLPENDVKAVAYVLAIASLDNRISDLRIGVKL